MALGGGMFWGPQSGGLNMGPRWRHVLEPQSGGLHNGPRWRHVLEPLSGGPLYGYPVFTPVLGYFALAAPGYAPAPLF